MEVLSLIGKLGGVANLKICFGFFYILVGLQIIRTAYTVEIRALQT